MAERQDGAETQDGTRRPHWPGFEALRREIDRAFAQVSGFPPWPGEAAMPVDMVETAEGLEITAELAGVDPAQVELTLAGRVLTIAGDKPDPHGGQKQGAPVSERRFGPFSRAITLPDDIDVGQIAAHFAGGVLTVLIPRSFAAAPDAVRIPIRPG